MSPRPSLIHTGARAAICLCLSVPSRCPRSRLRGSFEAGIPAWVNRGFGFQVSGNSHVYEPVHRAWQYSLANLDAHNYVAGRGTPADWLPGCTINCRYKLISTINNPLSEGASVGSSNYSNNSRNTCTRYNVCTTAHGSGVCSSDWLQAPCT